MKSKRLLSLLVGCSALVACHNSNQKFKIIGEIEDMPEQTIVLEQLGANDVVSIVDSVHVKDKPTFELGGVSTEPGLYRLRFADNKFILLSIDKGNLKVTSDWNTLEQYKVLGSPASVQLSDFLKMFREKVRDFNTMNIVLDTLRARGNDSLLALAQKNYQDMNQEFTQMIENYADTTPYLPNAIFAARILNPAAESTFLNAFNQSLNRRFANTRMGHDFNEYFRKINLRQATANAAQPQPVETGNIAPDIKLATPNGSIVALSSLRGKYVLIDFWASWCGPCRAENPNVVAAYNKYKDKNFTVYGVSLDNNKEKWEQAIKDDGLVWTQVSDLKGWSNEAATIYSIRSIPSNLLIDPDGKIMAHNLRGEQLDEMLEQVFKAAQPDARQ